MAYLPCFTNSHSGTSISMLNFSQQFSHFKKNNHLKTGIIDNKYYLELASLI